MCRALVITHHGNRSASIIIKPDNLSLDHSTNRRARQSRAPTSETLPVCCRSKRTFDAR